MKNAIVGLSVIAVFLLGFIAPTFAADQKGDYSPEMQAKIENQEWTRLHESHSMDVKVNWPDGHQTQGIERHIEDLKALFVYAPDTRIKVHPIKFGSAEFTCVTGIMEGTFTKPMPIGNGKFIDPTGKSFKLPMATVGHWKNGVMVEEWLYWDNQTYMNQIGLGK